MEHTDGDEFGALPVREDPTIARVSRLEEIWDTEAARTAYEAAVARVEALDIDGDGDVDIVEVVRAELGVLDAYLAGRSGEDPIGRLAARLHRLVDRIDNDRQIDGY